MKKWLLSVVLALIAWPVLAAAPGPPGPAQALPYYNQPFDTLNAAINTLVGSINGGLVPLVAPGSATPGVSNAVPANLGHWRAALGKVRAGVGRATILNVGDSTTRGSLGGAAGSDTNSIFGSYPSRLSVILQGVGIPGTPMSSATALASVNTGSIFGLSNSGTAVLTEDSRLTLDSGWANSGFASLGGLLFTNSTTTGCINLNLGTTLFDSVSVYYATNTGLGSFTTTVDSGSSFGTTSTNATGGVGVVSYGPSSITRGTHAINVCRASGSLFIVGIKAWDSTIPGVDMLNAGWAGSLVANNVSTAQVFGPLPAIGTVAPDLTIINLTVNDWVAGTSVTSYATGLNTLATTAKNTGDCVFAVGPPSQITSAPIAQQQVYQNIVYSVAARNSCAVLDWTYLFTDWATANALGLEANALHPTNLGYADIAKMTASLLLP